MGQTISNSREQPKSFNNEIVIQITKKQLLVFFQLVVISAILYY